MEPFYFIGLLPRNIEYQRSVLLLTDGDVYNTLQVIDTVRKQRLETSAKYMAIGIGSGASMQLVRGVAEAGSGKALMISDSEDPVTFSIKLKSLVKDTITPFLKDFSIEFDPNYVDAIAPLLGKSHQINPNEPVMVYALLKNSIEKLESQQTMINISYTDPLSLRRVKKIFTLSLKNEVEGPMILHKTAVYHILRADELNLKTFFISSSLASSTDFLTKLSIAYQVLSSKYTAFICVVAENTVNPYDSQNIIVPSIPSDDYRPRSGNVLVSLMVALLLLLCIALY